MVFDGTLSHHPTGLAPGDPIVIVPRPVRALASAEPDPAYLWDTHHPDAAGHAAYLAGLQGDDPESLVPAGLAPGRPPGRVRRAEERGHRVSEVPQGLLLDHMGADGQPWVLCARLGQLPALLQISRGARAARMPVRVLFHC